MEQYDSKHDEQSKVFPTPKHHLVNLNSYLCSYLTNPAMYLLSAARARQVVETHCGPEEKLLVRPGKSCIGQGETAEEEEVTGTTGDGEMNSKKVRTCTKVFVMGVFLLWVGARKITAVYIC